MYHSYSGCIGLNPRWTEKFEFFVAVPDLAIIRINVKDHQTLLSNDIIGQCTLAVNSIQQGTFILYLESANCFSKLT